MDLEKQYRDSEGNKCTIIQMVLREPEWAANRIQAGEVAIEKIERLQKTSLCPACKTGDIGYHGACGNCGCKWVIETKHFT